MRNHFQLYASLAMDSLNSHSGGTAIAQLNLSRRVFENTFSMGTSLRLHQATEMRGSWNKHMKDISSENVQTIPPKRLQRKYVPYS